MSEFFYRTEDISPTQVREYFIETEEDRDAINQLKGRNPTVLVGSRGVGKSFLMRVAEQELIEELNQSRVVPVYMSFVSSSLLRTGDPNQFQHWMLARICSAILRSVKKLGLMPATPPSAKILAGLPRDHADVDGLEKIVAEYEASWKHPGQGVDASRVPSVDDVKDAVEDLSAELGIERFALFMDEAAHIFIPTQQRQFFTLFRDLRTHCITCNAAVYPGVTSFGETFQPSHDATMVSINRDILAEGYVQSMQRIVEKQADSRLLKSISRNGRNFGILAYAATGNPRILLKTVFAAQKMGSAEINNVIREFYRSTIWAEHSALSDKYVGHKEIIDWGRNFMEDVVLPGLKAKNEGYINRERNTTAFIWIHRDAPEVVKEALRILCYTGVLTEHSEGIRATRSEVGKRYTVNLGCLFSYESNPASTSFEIVQALTPKRMGEYGAHHLEFVKLVAKDVDVSGIKEGFNLEEQLTKPNSVLDVTEWQRGKLGELGLETVGDVLRATEDELKEARYVGDVRARRMRNAAVASVLEYLSG